MENKNITQRVNEYLGTNYKGLITKIEWENISKGQNLSKVPASNNPQITIGTKIRSKTNPDVILTIISDDCHEDEFECSNGSVLSLKQIKKYYNII